MAHEGRRVSSKRPSRVWTGDKGVAGRNYIESCFPDEGSLIRTPGNSKKKQPEKKQKKVALVARPGGTARPEWIFKTSQSEAWGPRHPPNQVWSQTDIFLCFLSTDFMSLSRAKPHSETTISVTYLNANPQEIENLRLKLKQLLRTTSFKNLLLRQLEYVQRKKYRREGTLFLRTGEHLVLIFALNPQ